MIKALIADDSAVLRMVLKDLLESKGTITVVGAAKNGKEAVEMVGTLKPDILILDCEMPVMDGLEALKQIMEKNPLPVLMFSAHTSEGAYITIKALELGALDFLLKPTGGTKLTDVSSELETKIKTLVRQYKFLSLKSKLSGTKQVLNATLTTPPKPVSDVRTTGKGVDIIAIGSSTGGVKASGLVVPLFPKDFPPIVWVQHMPASFTESFAKRMNEISNVTVLEAKNGDILESGYCYLAPGGKQMSVKKEGNQYKLYVREDARVNGHAPSCDVLFDSISELFNKNSVGIILTGMGEDGAKGLLKMHAKGSYIVGQNEASCVVYGMPKAANKIGAVNKELDISDIAKDVVDYIVRK